MGLYHVGDLGPPEHWLVNQPDCEACGGTGRVKYENPEMGEGTITKDCEACCGRGKLPYKEEK